MNHLSSEQISKVAAGVCSREELQHSRDCRKCAEKVTRVMELLSIFRGSMRDWSEKQEHIETPVTAPASIRLHWQPRVWMLAWALLAIVITAPVYKYIKEREVKAEADREAAAQELKDAMLMDDVNAQLSRTAAAAMEPLMKLMPVESGKQQSKARNGDVK